MRIAGEKNIVPDDATRNEIGEAGKEKLIGSYKLCLARSGLVVSVTQLKGTGFPSYDQKIMTTIRTQWRYRPFLVDGKPARVCTAVTFIYSQHNVRPSPSRNVPLQTVELMRIAGEKNIFPDDVTKTAIIESGTARVISSFKVCITSAGTIASVKQLKTTGFPAFDQKIMTTIGSQWRYRPIVIDGKPTNVCTAVTFIYAPDVPRPAPPPPTPTP